LRRSDVLAVILERQSSLTWGDSFAMHREPPTFRATIHRNGTIRLVDWGPWLATGGPLNSLLQARGRAGIAIADLTTIRDEAGIATELIVAFRCGESPTHREALTAWAACVGYRRVWLDDQIVELEPIPGGAAQTRCTGCRARIIDADESFWEFVRLRGAFPTACVLCGSDLPQWTPVGQKKTGARDSDPTVKSRRSACR